MKTYYITSPNTCCLTVAGQSITYTQNFNGPVEVVDSGSFEEFLTPDDALARAREIDPSYPANVILGPLTATVTNSSDPNPTVSKNDDVTFLCEIECEGLPITYSWTGADGALIPEANTDTLTLLSVSPEQEGTYTCIGSAENAKGQTGAAGVAFTLTVLNNQGSGLG